MSLKLMSEVVPAFTNQTGVFNPVYFDYNPDIIEPNLQTLTSVNQFYYDINEDIYYLWVWFDQKYWPGWGTARFKFNASTGVLIERSEENWWASVYTHFASSALGGFLFGTRNDQCYVYGMNATDLTLNGFVTNNWRYTSPSLWQIYRYATVNMEDRLLIGAGNGSFDVYDYTVPSLKHYMPQVGVTQSLVMEDNELLWAAHTNGLITKYNYKKNRYEMISTLEYRDISDLSGIRIAYDSTRKRLGVFLWVPDNTLTGENQCRLQFYDLLPQGALLTSPVPLAELKQGVVTSFGLSLVGDAGEPISGKSITCTLDAPADGVLYDGVIYTDTTGQTTTRYKPELSGVEDTIRAEVEI
jgi:hypothetical protein